MAPTRRSGPPVTSANRPDGSLAAAAATLAVIAGLFALPLVNLVAPVIATAFMLHIFEALPRRGEHTFGEHPFGRTP